MRKLLFFAGMAFSFVAEAGWYQGKVKNVFPVDHSGGRVYVFLYEGSGEATCENGTAFFIDPNTEMGKIFVSVALVAKTTEKLVWVAGNGHCVEGWPSNGGEGLSSIDLKG